MVLAQGELSTILSLPSTQGFIEDALGGAGKMIHEISTCFAQSTELEITVLHSQHH